MLETTTVAIPDRGHIVSVRQRGYVATGVQACNLPHPCWRSTLDSLHSEPIGSTAIYCEHKLFHTATWHNGYQDSLWATLALLDNRRLATGDERKQLTSNTGRYKLDTNRYRLKLRQSNRLSELAMPTRNLDLSL